MKTGLLTEFYRTYRKEDSSSYHNGRLVMSFFNGKLVRCPDERQTDINKYTHTKKRTYSLDSMVFKKTGDHVSKTSQ